MPVVGHGDADAGNDLGEGIVVDAVFEGTCVDVVSIPESWHADGVRADAESGFQMFGVHQKARKFVAVFIQAEQYAKTYIVDAAFHGPVHGLGVGNRNCVSGQLDAVQVAFFMVGFLEQNVGADAGLFEQPVIVHCGGGDIDIYPADRAVFMFDTVNWC